jgi:hypothetical protein
MGRAALKGTCMYPPALRLRHAREKLGLTYRDVERASYEIAARTGRPEFILHISGLADIENRNVYLTEPWTCSPAGERTERFD